MSGVNLFSNDQQPLVHDRSHTPVVIVVKFCDAESCCNPQTHCGSQRCDTRLNKAWEATRPLSWWTWTRPPPPNRPR